MPQRKLNFDIKWVIMIFYASKQTSTAYYSIDEFIFGRHLHSFRRNISKTLTYSGENVRTNYCTNAAITLTMPALPGAG